MVDFEAAKKRQREAWSSGDFSRVATLAVLVGELLCEAVRLHAREKVLDVATGSGNTALAAARRRCEVVGVDFVPALLERARLRAEAEQLSAEFKEGDAERLPFPDGGFDCVLSTFGSMFAPNQEKAASELIRVCRGGGRVGLACWTPESFPGSLFRTVAKHVPPPQGLKPPTRWGTKEGLLELFGDAVDLELERSSVSMRGDTAEAFVDFFRRYFGPTLKAFEALSPPARAGLQSDLVSEVNRFNRSGDDTILIPSEYLQIVATKR